MCIEFYTLMIHRCGLMCIQYQRSWHIVSLTMEIMGATAWMFMLFLLFKVTAACNQRLHSQYWLTGHKGCVDCSC